jgi:hypothetical protein
LFSSTGGAGHLQPLLPLAVAFAARGDAMKVAGPRNHRARVEAEGLELAEVGPTPEALRAEALAHQHRVGQLPVSARRPVAFSGLFGKLEAPARLNGLRSLLEQWSPAVVIYESADLAAPIAAAEAGTRFLNHAFGPAIPEAALKMAADVVAPLWTGVGLDPDPRGSLRRFVHRHLPSFGCRHRCRSNRRTDSRFDQSTPPTETSRPASGPLSTSPFEPCTAIGAAEMIRPAELKPDTLQDAVTSVLKSPEHTNAARVLATEIAAMPPPSATASHIVTILE